MKIIKLDNPQKLVKFFGEKFIVPAWVNWMALSKTGVLMGYAAEPTPDKGRDLFLLNTHNDNCVRLGEIELDYTSWFNTVRYVGPDAYPY